MPSESRQHLEAILAHYWHAESDRNALRACFHLACEFEEDICIYLTNDGSKFAWVTFNNSNRVSIPPSAIVTPKGEVLTRV